MSGKFVGGGAISEGGKKKEDPGKKEQL